jgi:hypothetical protein
VLLPRVARGASGYDGSTREAHRHRPSPRRGVRSCFFVVSAQLVRSPTRSPFPKRPGKQLVIFPHSHSLGQTRDAQCHRRRCRSAQVFGELFQEGVYFVAEYVKIFTTFGRTLNRTERSGVGIAYKSFYKYIIDLATPVYSPNRRLQWSKCIGAFVQEPEEGLESRPSCFCSGLDSARRRGD